MPQLHALYLDGIDRPVVLPSNPGLIEALRDCIHGWPARLAPLDLSAPGLPPALSVIEPRRTGRYRAHSCFLEAPIDGLPAAAAICAVLADLSQAYSETPGAHVFGLHCGCAAIGRHGMILAGERRAGKSTLVARLSAEPGVTVLCDDVLPLTANGRAIALGLAPRLRLPLPVAASAEFRAHVARWLGPADDRYGYLLAPGLAPHGQQVRADTLLLLDRRPAGPASLHRLLPGEALRHILERSISGPDAPDQAFAAARVLAARLTGLRLVFSDLEEAVALLLAAFPATGRPAAPVLPPLAAGLGPVPGTAAEGPPLPDPAERLCRSPGTAVRRAGDAAFLWRPGEAMLWHLNPVARAVWTLLARPASALDLARDLALIFPDVSPTRLLADVRALLAGLRAEALIRPAAEPGARFKPLPVARQ